MTLRVCPCCKKHNTSKLYTIIGRNLLGLWLNCLLCRSTILIGRGVVEK